MFILVPELLPGNMVMGEVQEFKPNCTNSIQASACVTSVTISLAKAIYMAKPNSREEAHSTYHEAKASYMAKITVDGVGI